MTEDANTLIESLKAENVALREENTRLQKMNASLADQIRTLQTHQEKIAREVEALKRTGNFRPPLRG